MTSKEFTAWVQGLAAATEGSPTDYQWDMLCEKLREVEDEPISEAAETMGGEMEVGITEGAMHIPSGCPNCRAVATSLSSLWRS